MADAAPDKVGQLRDALDRCARALTVLQHPDFAVVRAYYEGVVSDYDALLHNVNVDEKVRDRACFGKDVALKLLRAEQYFEQKRKALKAELDREQATTNGHRPIFEGVTFKR